MKCPSVPDERACYRNKGDYNDGYYCCPSISCDAGYGVNCVGIIPCWGDCSNCSKTPIWRGRCLCYKRRMILDKEESQ